MEKATLGMVAEAFELTGQPDGEVRSERLIPWLDPHPDPAAGEGDADRHANKVARLSPGAAAQDAGRAGRGSVRAAEEGDPSIPVGTPVAALGDV